MIENKRRMRCSKRRVGMNIVRNVTEEKTALSLWAMAIWLVLAASAVTTATATPTTFFMNTITPNVVPPHHVPAQMHTAPPPQVYKYGGGAAQFVNRPLNHSTTLTTARKMEQETYKADAGDCDKLRSDFLHVLRSRRSAHVPLTVQPGMPVLEPLYQETPRPTYSEAMESTPKANISNFKELLREENFYLTTEGGEQGRLPVLILRMAESNHKKRPAIVFLHSTKKCKEWLRPMLEAYASRGYIAIAIDSRYHGERATSVTTYQDALVSAWKSGETMPFIFDTVWDLIKLADYLMERKDIDHSRIGITGESLGGMHAWFAAFADFRYSVVVPIIGVQGFRWAIDNDKWQPRVDSIKPVFEEARVDLGKSAIDKEVVEKVWDRIAPGIASQFDAPYSVPVIAPRPLLFINGELDPRCPRAGLDVPMSNAQKAYEKAHSPDNLKLILEPGIGHAMTSLMVKEASDWFDKFLQ